MILKDLIQEFEQEVTSTRKLLQSVLEKDINFKPSQNSCTMDELAQHIATIYYWYVGTLTKEVYDMAADHLERGEPDDIKATLALFESNVDKARAALKSITEEKLKENWTMTVGDKVVWARSREGLLLGAFCLTTFTTTVEK